jgi:hypothetical protein
MGAVAYIKDAFSEVLSEAAALPGLHRGLAWAIMTKGERYKEPVALAA